MGGRDGVSRRGTEPTEPQGGVWATLFAGRQAGWGGIAVVAAAVAGGLPTGRLAPWGEASSRPRSR